MAEVKNKELLQEITKTMPLFGKQSHIMWDVPTREFSQQLQSNPVEFATNEQHRMLDAKSAYAYKDDEQDFIADQVAPNYPVTSLIGEYRKIDTRTFYDRPETAAGPHTAPNLAEMGSALEDWDLTGRALAMYLSNVDKDTAVAQWGSVSKWRNIMTLFLTRLLLLDREMTVASLYQTSGNYASNATATPLWSDNAATLQDDVMTGEDALLAPRDALVVGYDIYRQCQKHPAVTGATTVSARRRGEAQPYATHDAIENFFDSKVVVGRAHYNSAPENTSTPTLSRIWANYISVVHLGDGGELAAPFAKTYKLRSSTFPNVEGWSVKEVTDSSSMAGGSVLMVGYFGQEKSFASDAGYLLKGL